MRFIRKRRIGIKKNVGFNGLKFLRLIYTATSGAYGDIGELGGLVIHPQKRSGDDRGPFCSEIVIVRKV